MSRLILAHHMMAWGSEKYRQLAITDEWLESINAGGGWQYWLKQNEDVIAQTGIKRQLVNRLFGHPVGQPVQFGAHEQCRREFPKELKSLWKHDQFVEDWGHWIERNEIEECIAYIGTPSLDYIYKELERFDERAEYVSESLNSITQAGLSVCLDAAGSRVGNTDRAIANWLADSVKTYIEPEYNHNNLDDGYIETNPIDRNKVGVLCDARYWFGNAKEYKARSFETSLGGAKEIILWMDGSMHPSKNQQIKSVTEAGAERLEEMLNYRLPDNSRLTLIINGWWARRALEHGVWKDSWLTA